MPVNPLDWNDDGTVDYLDFNIAYNFFFNDGTLTSGEYSLLYDLADTMGVGGDIDEFLQSTNPEYFSLFVSSSTVGDPSFMSGLSSRMTSPTGNIKELQRMLESYKGRTSLIQAAQRQKAIYTIDRFDGGLNLNKSPRDLAYWETCRMNELSPSKAGRLVRLGDFAKDWDSSGAAGSHYEDLVDDSTTDIENYGLHYFKWSNEKDLGASGAPANYIAMQDGNDINIWDLSDGTTTPNVITSLNASANPVYHSASNRLYVSDASFASTKTYMCGIVDRRKLFPFDDSGTLTYNITGDSHLFTNELLYHTFPTKGLADGNIMVTGTQADSTQIASLTRLMNTAASSGGTQHHGIYLNVNFEDITGDITGTGWGGSLAGDFKYYKIFASFIYDDGSETQLTDVTSNDNAADSSDVIKATTTDAGVYQALVVKQVIIDGAGIVASTAVDSGSRIHGVRFYYTETNSSGNVIGDDKYLWAELDFRYGFKLMSEFGHWNQFEDDNNGSGHSQTTMIQVLGAANANDDTSADGTLSLDSPPKAFTYYSLNLFHQEELKDDLMWKTSTVGNGIAFIGNIKYDGREYAHTMLYSGAGETDSGSVYPMWGTFPVDSNRIDIPGAGGEITALKWTKNKVLQFRQNALYIVNVEEVLAPKIDGVYQGMGVAGQYAVTETSFGVAWVNENGAYAYNAEQGKVRSLTIGRIDSEDFGADSASKIGYDDRAKMLIIGNYNRRATDGYHFAYSFITDAWCTWDTNANSYTPKTNFAIDHDGYLSGGTQSNNDLVIYKWSVTANGAVDVDYITKDIDMGKPSLDKRFYTLYISYTGGVSNALDLYFRVNGKEGADIANGWNRIDTFQDYTDPYGTTNATAWNDSSGTPVSGDPTINLDDGLDSVSVAEVQKLAKINFRNIVASSGNVDDTISGSLIPADYLKFARSIQFRIKGTAATTFEINDISLVFKEKRIK